MESPNENSAINLPLADEISSVFDFFDRKFGRSDAIDLTRLYYERLDNDYEYQDSDHHSNVEEEQFPFSDQP